MVKRKEALKYIVTSLSVILIVNVTIIDTGASSTPKNLVNLYTHSSNDNINSTGLFQPQNEYQLRQSKIANERNRVLNAPNHDALFDHNPTDLSFSGAIDYVYQDGRLSTTIPDCKGRIKLNGTRGYISDGSGFYQVNLQCIWLIDSGKKNATIRLQLQKFNTECNYDYLYIFDGDSIQSPLVAALSGDMKDFSSPLSDRALRNKISNPNNSDMSGLPSSNLTNELPAKLSSGSPFEIKTTSGKAFIYFHSDTAQSMSGFYLSYTIDSCPLDCSGRGSCDHVTLSCKCNNGYYGDGCQAVICPNNCTSSIHGTCDKDRSCLCNQGFYGHDCSLILDQQFWHNIDIPVQSNLARAFHQAAVVGRTMWIVGGRTELSSNSNIITYKGKKTVMVTGFDFESLQWTNISIQGISGVDHIAEVVGHSVVVKGSKLFIYGGMAINNSVLDTLSVFETTNQTLTEISNRGRRGPEDKFSIPMASVGHSANIVNDTMYVFLGYNPIFGYLNFVQKYNIAENKWTLVERKGSFITGCIGHTTVYDPNDRLIYLYGGHHAQRMSSLYSFDVSTEIWTLLQPGSSPRYYHGSIIAGRQLLIIGGNSYNTSHQNDQCFRQTVLSYNLDCKKTDSKPDIDLPRAGDDKCHNYCWSSIDSDQPDVPKRHGHSVVEYNGSAIMFGGFNGLILSDIHMLTFGKCESFKNASSCSKPKLGLDCHWNMFDSRCEDRSVAVATSTSSFFSDTSNCSKVESRLFQEACESRKSCSDCLSTDLGCVWCAFSSECHYRRCEKMIYDKGNSDPDLCFKEAFAKNPLLGMSITIKEPPDTSDFDNESECKRIDNCFLCQSKPHCSWHLDLCVFSSSSVLTSDQSSFPHFSREDLNEIYGSNNLAPRLTSVMANPNSTRSIQRYDPLNRSLLAALTSNLLAAPNPYHSCEAPCYLRHSCNECISNKCIWCSTSEQCLESSAYFVYHPMGQCLHYVAHMLKCQFSSCSDIESCDKCLANPKCGWLNDIGNTGKGKCLEGTSAGPSYDRLLLDSPTGNTSLLNLLTVLPNWFYTSCPLCQCNGHSYCRANSSACILPCQDDTEGPQCERCIAGYYGDPVNGGSCRPCRCNGHAQTCNRESGKCYCSTKGIVGHNCNRCDDQNHYVGDPLMPPNGTCYYNLTTDYQYTFNMSKTEDHFYSDINFINLPVRKDIEIDFTIACSRLALVNITSGTSYNNRKQIYSDKECGSIRLRLTPDKHEVSDANYSYFVHVHRFQTPFILQIAFSQHRTIYLPQVFFTFSR